MERHGDLAGGEVGVDVVRLPVEIHGQRGDDRDDAEVEGVEDGTGVNADHAADEPDVGLRAGDRVEGERLLAAEDPLAGDLRADAARFEDGINEGAVDLVVQHVVHDLDGRGVGEAEAVHEARFDVELLQAGGDGLAAAVHDDDLHADGFEQDDVAHGAGGEFGVLHGAAAELDDGDGVAELLDVGERLHENVRLVDEIFLIVQIGEPPAIQIHFRTDNVFRVQPVITSLHMRQENY